MSLSSTGLTRCPAGYLVFYPLCLRCLPLPGKDPIPVIPGLLSLCPRGTCFHVLLLCSGAPGGGTSLHLDNAHTWSIFRLPTMPQEDLGTCPSLVYEQIDVSSSWIPNTYPGFLQLLVPPSEGSFSGNQQPTGSLHSLPLLSSSLRTWRSCHWLSADSSSALRNPHNYAALVRITREWSSCIKTDANTLVFSAVLYGNVQRLFISILDYFKSCKKPRIYPTLH